MSVTANIKRLRESVNLTQNELADKLGVARTTVTQWENGWSKPRMGMVEKLAAVFHVSTSDIVAEGPIDQSSDAELDRICRNYSSMSDEGKQALVATSDALLSVFENCAGGGPSMPSSAD